MSLSFHTDNRLMSRVTPSLEAARLVTAAGLGWEDLRRMGELAVQASFLDTGHRQHAWRALATWESTQGLP